MTQHAPLIFFSAGEASGDQHAAALFRELKQQQANAIGIGMGGANMAQAGIEVCYDSRQIAVMGAIEVVKHFAEIRRALKYLKQLILERRPDLLICVDYKEFNLNLARYAKKHGVKVLFYVGPQVWAWRSGRAKTYGKAVDMMAVIFPFETPYYEAVNVPVRYVGHPSIDKVKTHYSPAENRQRLGLNFNQPVVGLLPGSRASEIKRLLPVMLAAAEILHIDFPDLQFVLPQADTIADELLQSDLTTSPLKIIVTQQQPYDTVQCCDAVMSSSGTATLETALLGVPMVICYKLAPITYWLGRLLVKTPFIGLPNIVFGDAIIKELIQDAASPENLAGEIKRLLTDADYAQTMRDHLRTVQNKLGNGGGSKRMADLALSLIHSNV